MYDQSSNLSQLQNFVPQGKLPLPMGYKFCNS